MRVIYSLLLVLLIGACTSRGGYPPPERAPQPDRPEQPRPEQPAPAPQPTPIPQPAPAPPPQPAPKVGDVSGPAVMALFARATEREQAGDLDAAAASIERALDVEPRNPFVYQRLGALRLEQGQPQQAEVLARKSNSFAGNNDPLKADNWRLIARARSSRGDTVGASSASSRAQYHAGRSR